MDLRGKWPSTVISGTFREYVLQFMYNRGLFEKQALEVMAAIESDESNDSMSGRWDDQTDGYPKQILAVIQLSTRWAATRWIEEHCPQHWAKGAFALACKPDPLDLQKVGVLGRRPLDL